MCYLKMLCHSLYNFIILMLCYFVEIYIVKSTSCSIFSWVNKMIFYDENVIIWRVIYRFSWFFFGSLSDTYMMKLSFSRVSSALSIFSLVVWHHCMCFSFNMHYSTFYIILGELFFSRVSIALSIFSLFVWQHCMCFSFNMHYSIFYIILGEFFFFLGRVKMLLSLIIIVFFIKIKY